MAAAPFVLPVIYATLSLYPTVKHSVEFFGVSMNMKNISPSPLPVLSWSSLSPLPVLSFGLDFSVLDLPLIRETETGVYFVILQNFNIFNDM